jgi:hypothetical protein
MMIQAMILMMIQPMMIDAYDSSDSDCDSDSHTETMSVSDSDEDQIGNNDMLELFNTDSDESDFDGF